jgi:hypothetical protein
MADNDQNNSLIRVSDIFGTSKPAVRLIDAIERGVGNLLRPWNLRRTSDVELSNFERWQSALEKSGLSVNHAELTLHDRATIRLTAQEVRRQENREKIAFDTVIEFKEEIENTAHVTDNAESPDDEWLDRFWRLAQDVTNADMQRVWARVLARHASGTTTYSPRCLDALSLLSLQEARLLEKAASIACSFDDHQNGGIILDINHANDIHRLVDPENQIHNAVGEIQRELLGSIGILIQSGFAHPFYLTFEGGIGHFRIAGKRYSLRSSLEHSFASDIGSGVGLTPLGSELISLISTDPDAKYVAALKNVFEVFGLLLSEA